ncbi:MAG: ABC transporter permease subunit [Alphaproteobacteria bacterium]|nr:ABC transporter permease subunit [Alphaproteobacteria bacterium]
MTSPRTSRRRQFGDLLMVAPLALFLGTMVLVPLVIAVLSSVGMTTVAPGLTGEFTLQGFREFFDPTKPSLAALWFTFKVTLVTTAISTGLGLALALFMRFRRIALGQVMSFLVKIPLFMPYLVTAFVFWVLLYPKGYIGILTHKLLVEYLALVEQAPALISDPLGIGIIVCGSWMRFPYAFVIIHGLLQMIDPSYEEAARTLGARTGRIVRRVYLPLVGYGLLSVALLNFLALFIAFSIPFVLGASWPQFLSVFIYVNAKDQGNWLAGYTASVVYIVIALAIATFYTRALQRAKTHA